MKPSIFLNELIDLKHMETLEKMPFEAQHKIFKRLAEIADSKTLTKEEQEKYDNSMMVMWDNYAIYKHAEEKGIIKGEAKGRAEGRVEEKKRDCFKSIGVQHSNRYYCKVHRIIYRGNQEIKIISA